MEFGFKHMLLTLWQNVYPLVKLNLCFLLFCLPVLTIPPALTALHAGCVDLIRGRQVGVFRLYADAVKRQFFPSWAVVAAIVLPLALCVSSAGFYFTRVGGRSILLLPGLVMSTISVILLLMLPYAVTMQASVGLKPGEIIKNAFLLAFLNLRFSFCSSLLILLILFLSLLYWLRAIPLILAISPALCGYIGSYFSLYALQRYVLTEAL